MSIETNHTTRAVYTCDRCLSMAVTESDDIEFAPAYPDGWRRFKIQLGEGRVEREGDLCSDCRVAFAAFVMIGRGG